MLPLLKTSERRYRVTRILTSLKARPEARDEVLRGVALKQDSRDRGVGHPSASICAEVEKSRCLVTEWNPGFLERLGPVPGGGWVVQLHSVIGDH